MPIYPDFYIATLALPESRQLALERLEMIANDIPAGIDVSTVVADGKVAEEIAAFAEEAGDDLIVVSSHGYSGVKRMLMGSVAEGVTRRAECPVLVLRAGSRELLTDAVES